MADKRGVMNWEKLRKPSLTNFRVLHGKYLFILTGSGTEIGREICNLIFQENGILPTAMAGSKLLLLGDDIAMLRAMLNKEIKKDLAQKKIQVDFYRLDMSDLSDIKLTIDQIIVKNDKDFEKVILINNIPTLSNTGEDKNNISENCKVQFHYSILQGYLNMHASSKIFLTTVFCNTFSRSKVTVIDIIYPEDSNEMQFLALPSIATNSANLFYENFAKENPIVRLIRIPSLPINSFKIQEIIGKCNDEPEVAKQQ